MRSGKTCPTFLKSCPTFLKTKSSQFNIHKLQNPPLQYQTTKQQRKMTNNNNNSNSCAANPMIFLDNQNLRTMTANSFLQEDAPEAGSGTTASSAIPQQQRQRQEMAKLRSILQEAIDLLDDWDDEDEL
ncbi:expressed unknown protein [Seminavis robusta]|uniref:Uncharacterized protein n=1 Tax=Seminavis robusta TaxID=568900 RepID=A0A9N8D997_9STRA|nr:expressed unknown protein [Seminavis robusta]|eukprot:Sro45_g026900.1 n/a (129) ;mRNA; f:66851-67237